MRQREQGTIEIPLRDICCLKLSVVLQPVPRDQARDGGCEAGANDDNSALLDERLPVAAEWFACDRGASLDETHEQRVLEQREANCGR